MRSTTVGQSGAYTNALGRTLIEEGRLLGIQRTEEKFRDESTERRQGPHTEHNRYMDSEEDEIEKVAFASPYALHRRGS